MKAILHYPASPGFRRSLDDIAPEWLHVAIVDPNDARRFADEMGDGEVLLHVLAPVTAAVIESAPRLRFIQKIGVGVDTIDLDAAEARGIAVANMPGTNSQAVAEMALALMLATLRNLLYLDRATRSGSGWRLEPDRFDDAGELNRRTVGLVGYGRVGRLVARIVSVFGATALAYDPQGVEGGDAEPRGFPDLLRQADIISLHAPLTPQTAGMMNAESFAAMKRGSVLINTSRGGLVDEPALVSALKSGHLRGAGLDVFATEPVDPESEILRLGNVVVSPHVAWLTPETLARSLEFAIENCRRVRDGEEILNRVV